MEEKMREAFALWLEWLAKNTIGGIGEEWKNKKKECRGGDAEKEELSPWPPDLPPGC